jgi:hypothetical protein
MISSIHLQGAGIAMGYGLESQGLIASRGKIFLLSIASKLALGHTQPPIKWVPQAISPRIKWLGCEADHSFPSNAKFKNGGAISPLPNTSSWCGA